MMTKCRVKMIIAAIWMYAIVWGIAGNIDWSGSGESIRITNGLECVLTCRYYITIALVVLFHIPTVVMVIMHINMYQMANRHSHSIEILHKSVKQQKRRSQKRRFQNEVEKGDIRVLPVSMKRNIRCQKLDTHLDTHPMQNELDENNLVEINGFSSDRCAK